MKILILSPLFPPDVGAPAPYVKALIQKLKGHQVRALIYGYLPESVEGVTITAIDKRTWILRRLFSYTKALVKARKEADIIILNNAPSVELPMLLVSLFTTNTLVLCESDPLAHRASSQGFYRLLHRAITRQSKKIIVLPEAVLYTTPERLPFVVDNTTLTEKQNTWWTTHVNELTNI